MRSTQRVAQCGVALDGVTRGNLFKVACALTLVFTTQVHLAPYYASDWMVVIVPMTARSRKQEDIVSGL